MQDAKEAPGALDEAAADDGYDPTEGKVVTEEELQQQAERFNADISSRMKDKGDLFDEMVLHEEQIRLGEAGWKLRYYQVFPLCSSICIVGYIYLVDDLMKTEPASLQGLPLLVQLLSAAGNALWLDYLARAADTPSALSLLTD